MADGTPNRPSWMRFSGIGINFAAAVGGFAAVGYWVDRHWETLPVTLDDSWGLEVVRIGVAAAGPIGCGGHARTARADPGTALRLERRDGRRTRNGIFFMCIVAKGTVRHYV